MSAPSISNNLWSSAGGSNGTGTYENITVAENSVVIAIIAIQSTNGAVVTSLSSSWTSGTWTQRAATSGAVSGMVSGYKTDVEVWWNYTTNGVSDGTVTLDYQTADGGDYEVQVGIFSVSGAATLSSPWDSNASLPLIAVHTSSSAGDEISTTNNNDLIIQAGWYQSGSEPSLNGSVFMNENGYPGNTYFFFMGEYFSTDTTLSNSTIAQLASAYTPWIDYIDAIAGEASGISGTWSSTDGTDVMSMSGNIGQTGSWASTEAKDIFSAAGFPEIGGTWESTETPDIFEAAGYQNISGTWESTEAKDIFTADGMLVDETSINMTMPLLSMHLSVTEEFVNQIHMTLPTLNMALDVTEIIPTVIDMTLPGFTQVFEAEEVPASFFATGVIVMTLPGLNSNRVTGELIDVTTIPPEAYEQIISSGRGGEGGIPPRPADYGAQAELEMFRGKMYARGIDAMVPSTPVAHANLTTHFSTPQRPIIVPAPRGKPK